jgi:hypothetical protein
MPDDVHALRQLRRLTMTRRTPHLPTEPEVLVIQHNAVSRRRVARRCDQPDTHAPPPSGMLDGGEPLRGGQFKSTPTDQSEPGANVPSGVANWVLMTILPKLRAEGRRSSCC